MAPSNMWLDDDLPNSIDYSDDLAFCMAGDTQVRRKANSRVDVGSGQLRTRVITLR